MSRRIITYFAFLMVSFTGLSILGQDLVDNGVRDAMKSASKYYRSNASTRGGYVYHYTLDFATRWGEGIATDSQIWVQPPGTPTVGLAFATAFNATGDPFYLDAASEAALAIAYGQLESGGWTNCIDFDPRGKRTAAYRNGKGRGKNNSSLDDGQTQSAIRLLIHVDQLTGFKDKKIHNASITSLDALLQAQFPNGGFPQVWTQPVKPQPVRKASYPRYDWRTKGRIKNYWDMYTLNDNVCGYVADTLIDAHRIYNDKRYLDSLRQLGSFLILAQMPDPQPGWAQQYNYDMHPIWARKFEPAAVSGDESQEVIATLIKIAVATGDQRFLQPIPRALNYLEKSLLENNQLARYYELKTNRPLYIVRNGKQYSLTYDDSRLPKHYGWKTPSILTQLRKRYHAALNGSTLQVSPPTREEVLRIIGQLDSKGRWVNEHAGERLVGQPKFRIGQPYLSSQTFSDNLTTLARFLEQ